MGEIRAAASSPSAPNHALAAWCAASSDVTSIATSAKGGIAPSTNSRLPSGARKDTPRLAFTCLVPSSPAADAEFHPWPDTNPSAEKKRANLAWAAAVAVERSREIPLTMVRFYRAHTPHSRRPHSPRVEHP